MEDNPFLPKFYESRETYAFQNQTFFLLSRYRQQIELGQQDLFTEGTVSDYLFAKDQIFAALTLSTEELESLPANLCAIEYPRAQARFSRLPPGAPGGALQAGQKEG